MAADCFEDRKGKGFMFTTHQEKMVARQARTLRKTANAKSKWLAEHLSQLAGECQAKLERTLDEIEKLSSQIQTPFPLCRPSLKKKMQAALAKKKLGLASTRQRMQRLVASSKHHEELANNGVASMAFGGRKLANQVHGLDDEESTFQSKTEWEQAWQEARGQWWLFEGDKSASSANMSVKMDVDKGVLKVRLSDRLALVRMRSLARVLGVDPKNLQDSKEYSSQRMECRYLSLKLDMSSQEIKLKALKNALTPSSDEKYKGKTPPCEQPVSWRIWIAGDVSKPESCKVYARAMWAPKEVPLVTFASNGCLGVDINAWGVALAWCNPEGNKPGQGVDYRSNLPIDWTGSSEHILHEIRIAAKSIVDGAAKLGCPLCLEALDFSALKRRLRYEASREQAKRLSSFAYGKLLEAILARARKVGVEVRWVDPSWTSLVGWAKYGSEFGINADQAAAFCIARKGALSKNHMRRGKVLGEWVDVHAKPEKLDGLKSKAGIASLEAKIEEPKPATAEAKASVAKTRTAPRRQRSMPTGGASAERRLALALGRDRTLWPQRLTRAAKERALEGRSITRGNPGKGLQGGDASFPAEMSNQGSAQISTD